MMITDELRAFDPAIAETIENELNRQEYKLELIASENFVSLKMS